MDDAMRVEVVGDLALLTLARPERLNRFDDEMFEAFFRGFETLRSLDVRAAVLAAEGRVFCAGGDTSVMTRGSGENNDLHRPRRRREVLEVLLETEVPLVCALQGHAMGLGATIVLACDAVVSCPAARIADSHVRMGLVAGDGGMVLWPHSIGMLLAKRFLLTGDQIDGARAYELGLVTDLVETVDEVQPAARQLAERIASLPPLAVQATKRGLNHVYRQRAAEIFDLGMLLEHETMRSQDVREAIAAFKEKRPGRYQGR